MVPTTTPALCVLWMVMSSSGILLNNHILNDREFPFPFFLATIGQLFSACALWTMHICGHLDLRRRTVSGIGPSDDLREIYSEIGPIALLTALKLAFGNAVYMHLSVAIIQILKGGAPMITLLVMVQYRLETMRRNIIVSIIIIATGCALSISGELNMNWTGITFMIIGETAEAYKTVRTQNVMESCGRIELDRYQTLAFMAPATCFVMSLGIILVEVPRMGSDIYHKMAEMKVLFSAVAILGLGVNLLSLHIIQRTNSLTLKVIAQAKNVFAVFGGIALFGNTVSAIQWVAYMVTLMGFALYHKATLKKPSM